MTESSSSNGSLALKAGYALDVSDAGAAQRLDVRAPDGTVCLTITLGPEGPRVEVRAASLSIATEGAIELEGESVKLAARGDIVLKAGGDLRVEAEKAIEMTAFEQKLVATTGDLTIEANDDVRVEGERIRLNAPDAPALRRLNRGANVELPRAKKDPSEEGGS